MNEFRQCPKCKRYMTQFIAYSYGDPVVIYNCENCGYSSSDAKYYTSNKTTMTVGEMSSSTSAEFENFKR